MTRPRIGITLGDPALNRKSREQRPRIGPVAAGDYRLFGETDEHS
jgi:hypothetical protein